MAESHRDRLLRRAWELQDAKEHAEGKQKEKVELAQAASELGLDPRYIEEAEAKLAAEDAEAKARAAELAREQAEGKRKVALGVGVALALAAVLGGVFLALRPPPPFTDGFEGGWSLAQNPGTRSSVSYEQEAGRGQVAVLRVEAFSADADGKYWSNLNLPAPDLSGYEQVGFSVKGEGLQTVRLYLEDGDQRWRSPPLAVGADWQAHELRLDSFERQERRDGGWKVVGWEAPGPVDTLSFKVGEYMNPVDSRGELRLDELELE